MQESTFTPSDKQDELMRQLCRNLGLSHTEVTKDLTSHELYSAKLSDLIEQDRQRRSRADLEVSRHSTSTEQLHMLSVAHPGCSLTTQLPS